MTRTLETEREVKHAHLFCGIGGGAIGFNRGSARVGNVRAKSVCLGGIDVDPASCRDFETHVGVKATCIDLFTLEQYVAFHGKQPPPGWTQAMPTDVHKAFRNGQPNVAFLSAPCKGFSGLLSETSSKLAKYQALNGLTLRGVWLLLEAYKDDPVELLVFENVPRIATRGRFLLDQIIALLRSYGYAVAETTHDCGELGMLGQSRKRFLLVARHEQKVPAFLYEPVKHRLLGVGEVLERLPMPLSGLGGPMHRMPSLQWKTWVRLAFVRAGADWRSLNELAVEDGHLRDFGIVPSSEWHSGALGVRRWDEPSGAVTSRGTPTCGNFSVADPRAGELVSGERSNYGVTDWKQPGATVTSARSPGQGRGAVADPRGMGPDTRKHVLRVTDWKEPGGTVTAGHSPSNGALSVADPRIEQSGDYGQLGVREWEKPTGAVTAQALVGGGRNAVADPRLATERFNHAYRIVKWEQPSPGISSARGALAAVADPRSDGSFEGSGKYRVTPYDGPAGTVIAGSTTGQGAFALQDPRFNNWHPGASSSKLRITPWTDSARPVTGSQQVGSGAGAVADPRVDGEARSTRLGVKDWRDPAGVVAGESHPSNGAFSVADPRPTGWIDGRENYEGAGNYGVVGWEGPSRAVVGHGSHDNGYNSVADPRAELNDEKNASGLVLPAPADRLVCVILALDGTWHRPFTTLELAALQGLVDPDEKFELDGLSDSSWRERIGNCVPPPSATAIASVMFETLLLAWQGETFNLSNTPIWVRDVAAGLSIQAQEMPSW
jgi:site-specific DNA-cytosine methylase